MDEVQKDFGRRVERGTWLWMGCGGGRGTVELQALRGVWRQGGKHIERGGPEWG